MKLFLRWALVNSLFGCALTAVALAYHGHVHPVGKLAAGAVLMVFALGSAQCGWCAWHQDKQGLERVALAIKASPMIAMLGTVSGFLIAFSGSVDDVQKRVLGASTGLTATFVGISCALVL